MPNPRQSEGARTSTPWFSPWSPVFGVIGYTAGWTIRPAWVLLLLAVTGVVIAAPFPRFRMVVPAAWATITLGNIAYFILLLFGPATGAAIFG